MRFVVSFARRPFLADAPGRRCAGSLLRAESRAVARVRGPALALRRAAARWPDEVDRGVPSSRTAFTWQRRTAASGEPTMRADVDADLRFAGYRSVGSLAVAPSDPQHHLRRQRRRPAASRPLRRQRHLQSTDGGTTWTHLGLRDGQQIPGDRRRSRTTRSGSSSPCWAIRTVRTRERGVCTARTDGGATFQRVLSRDDNTGAYDVEIDPHDSHVVYATLWAARQAPWEIGGSFEIGGQRRLQVDRRRHDVDAAHERAPAAHRARVDGDRAVRNPRMVYARRRRAERLRRLSQRRRRRAFRAERITRTASCERGDDLVVDRGRTRAIQASSMSPTPRRIARPTAARRSPRSKARRAATIIKTFGSIPRHPEIIALVSDQGATISLNGGRTWSSWYNQPTAQMYHVSPTTAFRIGFAAASRRAARRASAAAATGARSRNAIGIPPARRSTATSSPDPLHPGFSSAGKSSGSTSARVRRKKFRRSRCAAAIYRVGSHRTAGVRPARSAHAVFRRERLFDSRRRAHWRHASAPISRERHTGDSRGHRRHSNATIRKKATHRGVVYALAPSYRHRGTHLGRNRRRTDLDHARRRRTGQTSPRRR